MKGLRLIIVSVFVLLLSACTNSLKNMDVTSLRLLSLAPKSLDSVTALVEIGINNPSMSFELSDINATIRFKAKDAIYVTADRLVVDARTEKLYDLPLNGKCAEDFNPFDLLQLVSNKADTKDISISVEAKVSMRGGLGKNIEYNEITLDQLLDKI